MIDIFTVSLLLSSGFMWDNVMEKKALRCERKALTTCLAQLPRGARAQVPNIGLLQASMGNRAAMVLPIHHTHIAGVIITDDSLLPQQSSVNVAGKHYTLVLDRQAELTYWHELGHLEAMAAMASIEQGISSQFTHEWLADLYLVWRIAHETGELNLAWQQYHRRNIDVMNSVAAMSHWSAPILAQVLVGYRADELQAFKSFKAFLIELLPKLTIPSEDSIAEFSSLIQRTFGAGSVQSLPGYMYWRKPALGEYLAPTLSTLMGRQTARRWLVTQDMQTQET